MKTATKAKWKKIGCAVGFSVVAMTAIVIGLIAWVMNRLDDYTHHGEAVSVPAVTGVPVERATAAIEAAGLRVMVIDSVFTDRAPGTVIEQLPEGGLPVKLGRIVYLTINAHGRQMIEMVNVSEWSSRQARSRLEEVGFIIDSLVYEPYEFDDLVLQVTSGDEDVIIGRKYPIRTHVVLHVGSTTVPVEEEIGELEQVWFE